MLGGFNYKINIWTSGFAIAFVFAIAVYETQNRSPEKTLNFVTFSEFLTHPRVHHTFCALAGLSAEAVDRIWQDAQGNE